MLSIASGFTLLLRREVSPEKLSFDTLGSVSVRHTSDKHPRRSLPVRVCVYYVCRCLIRAVFMRVLLRYGAQA